jgi:hypothetical protein
VTDLPLSEDKEALDTPTLPGFGSFMNEHVQLYDKLCDKIPRMRSLLKEVPGVDPSQRRLPVSAKVKTKVKAEQSKAFDFH